jgi:pantothenate kinase
MSRVLELSLAQIVARARALAIPGERHILGLTGAPAAGKSTIAEAIVTTLAAELGPQAVVLVPMDGFHLPTPELVRLGRRDRKGAPDTFDDVGYATLMSALREQDLAGGVPVLAPFFDRVTDEPVPDAIRVQASAALVVTEGNYLLLDAGAWPRARAVLDQVWFIVPPEEVRLERLITRHETYGKSPDAARAWALGPDQANASLVEATADSADLIIRPLS